ncbi:hypothetical protein M513_07125 [Trichuris suis]|uniref:Uncharacterized protein n=1 Tax=Trichuris suis TaxID=68888 RepID=A0A085M447_9BILA|nr:hypothetical protein M513_07125 [Trichuris suis]
MEKSAKLKMHRICLCLRPSSAFKAKTLIQYLKTLKEETRRQWASFTHWYLLTAERVGSGSSGFRCAHFNVYHFLPDMTFASDVAALFLLRYHSENLYEHLGKETERLFMSTAVLIFDGNSISSAQTIRQFYRSYGNVKSKVIHYDAQPIRSTYVCST